MCEQFTTVSLKSVTTSLHGRVKESGRRHNRLPLASIGRLRSKPQNGFFRIFPAFLRKEFTFESLLAFCGADVCAPLAAVAEDFAE
jgi:hypothetical protein